MKPRKHLEAGGFFLGLLTALVIAIHVLGPYIINPLQVKVLLQGDVGIHYLGWAFFRYADWSFPLGQIPDYYYPLGSNIGFTDSIPLMALLLKPFHSILPTDFQYIGPWLLLCVILQYGTAWNLLREWGIREPLSRMMGALFLTSTPVWFFRLAHPALCAHFLILGSFWMYIKSGKEGKQNQAVAGQYLLLFIVSFVHPYLAVMILALSWLLFARLALIDKTIKLWQWGLHLLVSAALLILNWWMTGYFSISEAGRAQTGLTDYSTNLNSLFNPMEGTSFFLPALPHNPLQYEGYAYLGMGGLILLVGSIFWATFRKVIGKKREWEKNTPSMWPLWTLLGLMAVWALSIKVYWGTTRVLRYDIAEALIPTLSAFRTTGRFIWPLYYLLLAFSFVYIKRSLPQKVYVPLVFLGLFALQLIDQQPLWEARRWYQWTEPENFMEISEEKWNPLFEAAEKVYLWPPFEMKHVRNRDDYAEIGYLAARNETPATIGFVARAEKDAESNFRKSFRRDLELGRVDSTVLYLFLPGATPYFNESFEQMDLLMVDGYIAGISQESILKLRQAWKELEAAYKPEQAKGEGIADFIERNKENFVLISSLDEPSQQLDRRTRDYLGSMGSGINKLSFRGSYLAVIHKGSLVHEQVAEGDLLELEINEGENLNGATFAWDLRMKSSGILKGYEMSIQVNGEELTEKKRGLYLVVIDEEGALVEKAHFDTYISSYRWK